MTFPWKVDRCPAFDELSKRTCGGPAFFMGLCHRHVPEDHPLGKEADDATGLVEALSDKIDHMWQSIDRGEPEQARRLAEHVVNDLRRATATFERVRNKIAEISRGGGT